MKSSFYIAAALASTAFLSPIQAEAARCAKGLVYRPSINVCVSKASAIRAGIYRARIVKRAPVKQRAKKPPVEHASTAPDPVVYGPFGALISIPETPASRLARWAAQNGEQSK